MDIHDQIIKIEDLEDIIQIKQEISMLKLGHPTFQNSIVLSDRIFELRSQITIQIKHPFH